MRKEIKIPKRIKKRMKENIEKIEKDLKEGRITEEDLGGRA